MTEWYAAPELARGYRLEAFGDAGAPDGAALIDFWVGEGSFDADTAARRMHEALFVVVGPGDEVAGVSTAALQRSRQLRLSFWNYAVVVGAAHRRQGLSVALHWSSRAELERRWNSGEDRRGAGLMIEIQHKGLLSSYEYFAENGYCFVGLNMGGHPLSVCYFPGAGAADPPRRGAPAEPGPVPAGDSAPPAGGGPVFVVAPPGSGGQALRDALAASPDLEVRTHDATPHPSERGWDDERLGAPDATTEAIERIAAALGGERRALVHRPADALQVPFLHRAFPDAVFVYVYRDPAESVPSALAAWESGWAATHPELPGWDGPPWSFALAPGWRSLKGATLAEIVAAQWETCTRMLIRDLRGLPSDRWSVVDHAAFGADPAAEVARLARFAAIRPGADPEPPAPDNQPLSPAAEIEAALTRTADAAALARTLFAAAPAAPSRRIAAPPPAPAPPSSAPRAVASESLRQVLTQTRSSILVSAPAAGMVGIARRAGQTVHTSFAPFDAPRGLAARDGLLAVGTAGAVAGFRDVPAAAQRVPGTIHNDACFVPGIHHHTGDVRVRDLAFAGDELWLVSSRFSCLATLDAANSFVPRWLPPFVSGLSAENRCGLNGLCMVGGAPRFVTSLGATDSLEGWKDGRERGGVVVDVPSGETVAAGLSLPHSPRWHDGRLWVLESGTSSLGTVDTGSGAFAAVAQLPGFPRGLSFLGSLAFVGLSARRDGGGECGVWVVDVSSARTVALLRFETEITEVGDVLVLPGVTYPEIVEADSDAALNSFLLPES